VLYSYRARWYLPEAGVFAERDPVDRTMFWNLYTFVNENPPNMIDPMGEQFSPYGGFNSEPENREVYRRYLAGEGTDYGRFTAGLVAEALGVTTNQQGALSAVLGGEGIHIGVNLQFWARNNGDVLGGVFAFDSYTAVQRRLSQGQDWGPFGPWGVVGEGASVQLAVDTARYRGPERRGFLDLLDDDVIQSWAGEFKSIGFSTPLVSLGGFWSSRYVGLEASLGAMGLGIGAAGSLTYYTCQGSRRLSTFAEMSDFVAENMDLLARTGGPFGAEVGNRLFLKYQHYKRLFVGLFQPPREGRR